MKIKISHIIFILLLNFNAVLYVEASDNSERLDVINRELDCFSDAASRGKVDWNDICLTTPSFVKDILADAPSRDEIIAKSMEQVIEEHRLAAQEMMDASSEEQDSVEKPRSVDEVYEQHGRYYGTEKDLDDVISAQDPDIEKNSRRDGPQRNVEPVQDYTGDGVPYVHLPVDSKEVSIGRDPFMNGKTAEIGFEFNRYRYSEPVFDLETQGNLFGMYVNFTARPEKNEALFDDLVDMYKTDIRFNYGLVDYKSAPSGELKNNQDWAIEARILVGKDLMASSDVRITPYTGFGYRYLNDDSAGRATSTGAVGYERESRYYYLPIGIELTTKISDSWAVTPSLEYDYLIQGEQLSHLSDVSWAYPDLRNKQRKGMGLRGSLKFIQLGDSINFVFEPYIRYWHIDDSEEATVSGPIFIVTGLEPENKTLEYGFRLGTIF